MSRVCAGSVSTAAPSPVSRPGPPPMVSQHRASLPVALAAAVAQPKPQQASAQPTVLPVRRVSAPAAPAAATASTAAVTLGFVTTPQRPAYSMVSQVRAGVAQEASAVLRTSRWAAPCSPEVRRRGTSPVMGCRPAAVAPRTLQQSPAAAAAMAAAAAAVAADAAMAAAVAAASAENAAGAALGTTSAPVAPTPTRRRHTAPSSVPLAVGQRSPPTPVGPPLFLHSTAASRSTSPRLRPGSTALPVAHATIVRQPPNEAIRSQWRHASSSSEAVPAVLRCASQPLMRAPDTVGSTRILPAPRSAGGASPLVPRYAWSAGSTDDILGSPVASDAVSSVPMQPAASQQDIIELYRRQEELQTRLLRAEREMEAKESETIELRREMELLQHKLAQQPRKVAAVDADATMPRPDPIPFIKPPSTPLSLRRGDGDGGNHNLKSVPLLRLSSLSGPRHKSCSSTPTRKTPGRSKDVLLHSHHAVGLHDGGRLSPHHGKGRSGAASVPHFVVLPYDVGDASISEKYLVDWGDRAGIGTLNGLYGRVPEKVGVSLFLKARAKGSGVQRVVKVVRKQRVRFTRMLQRQVADLRHLEHPNLCRLWDAFEDSRHVYLVFDSLTGPSLLEKANADPQFCERDAASALKAVLQAVSYLHGHHIAHLNLHPENLKYCGPPKKRGWGSSYHVHLKLFDFGSCVHLGFLSLLAQSGAGSEDGQLPLLPMLAGTEWCPPELRIGFRSLPDLLHDPLGPRGGNRSPPVPDRRRSSPPTSTASSSGMTPGSSVYSTSSWSACASGRHVEEVHKILEAADMWVAGCLQHLLLAGQPPAEQILEDEPQLPGGVCPAAKVLCGALLRRQPRERPTADEALQNVWFQQCDWLQRAHRSQFGPKGLAAPMAATPLTPMAPELKASLGMYHRVRVLRRVVTAVCSVLDPADDTREQLVFRAASAVPSEGRDDDSREARSCPGSAPGDRSGKTSVAATPVAPPFLGAWATDASTSAVSEAAEEEVLVDQAVRWMCRDAFRALQGGESNAASHLSLEALQAVVRRAGELPWRDPLEALENLSPGWRAHDITENQFTEFVLAASK